VTASSLVMIKMLWFITGFLTCLVGIILLGNVERK